MDIETSPTAVFRDSQQTVVARVEDLVGRLTLDEKLAQLVYEAPAVERLGIPKYTWWNEALHGLGRAGVATVFPQAIGLAATWNPELMKRVAGVIADEARAKHARAVQHGMRQIYTGLTFWSPNVNIFRDPRWGRGQETYGEDPYLTAKMGVAFVTGLQGDAPNSLKLAATPKHFAVHSGPESSRHTFEAQIGEQALRDFYLFAFEACVVEGKAASVMGAYNRVNGEACCASHLLLQTILRDEWGFEGYVVSDCGAVEDIFTNHHLTQSMAEAAALALKGGCDLECGGAYRSLGEALAQGLIIEADVDRAVSRLFAARFRLGLLDGLEAEMVSAISPEAVASPSHGELALQAARESIILLKNENNTLPLSKNIRSVAVIGPNANEAVVMLGNYNGTPASAVTPLQGIRQMVSSATEVFYAPGCGLAGEMTPLEVVPAEYLRTEEKLGEAGLRGDYYVGSKFEGEPSLQRIDPHVDFIWLDSGPISGQWGERFSVRWQGYLVPPTRGTYKLGVYGYSGYRLRLDGKVVVEGNFVDFPIRRIAEVTLEAGRPYPICLEAWNEGLDPQVQLLWAEPNLDYEAEALAVAGKAEVVVMVMGLSTFLEGEEMPAYEKVPGFLGGDRTEIGLPQVQENLLQKIHGLGKPVVLVLLNGSALAINWANANVDAIVEAWYPGQAGGEALAEVLFGDYNPGGKLPVTVYKSVEDLPPFEDYQLAGHTYRYFKGEALYPFGYGLSYTTFKLDNLKSDTQQLGMDDTCVVTVEVTNTGDRAGDEVVQLYAADARVADGPIKRLIGFKRLCLEANETQVVAFHIHVSQFGIHNEQAEFVLKRGGIDLLVGTSSSNLPLTGRVEITGEGLVKKKVFFSEVQVATNAG